MDKTKTVKTRKTPTPAFAVISFLVIVAVLVVLINLGVKRGMVVYGQDKLDEISLSAPTTICEMRDGWFKTEVITPEDFGFQRCTKEDLRGGTPAENAQITLNILKGEQGHKRNAVLLNAGPGGGADRLRQGAQNPGTAH